ncbi:MAG TPA: FAD:protein FMN transferase [Acidimicrobiales bacterium]|nr:FAD:protein FMN transferase [Acidimicrobiales bacterium]
MRTQIAPSTDTRFRAMGTDVHITIVDGPGTLLDLGQRRIAELEGRWSRFRPHSEVSALNHHAGHPVLVSADTYDLVTKAVAAWLATDGRFDPTVGAALIDLGYDRDFGAIRAARPEARSARSAAPTPAGIGLDPAVGAVTLPRGVTFDPGGIGKGLAADLVATVLLESGARGALVNIGGDLRAIGDAPGADGWVITVPEPAGPQEELLRLSIAHGAVATSSSLRRRWQTTTGEAHHLIDPTTGQPTDSDVHSVTVVAAEAWWAEVLTKYLYVLGPDGLASIDDAHAVVVMADGTRHSTDGIRGALR